MPDALVKMAACGPGKHPYLSGAFVMPEMAADAYRFSRAICSGAQSYVCCLISDASEKSITAVHTNTNRLMLLFF